MKLIQEISCNAPEEAKLENWEDIPESIRNEIDEMVGLRCDGGFEKREWCGRCKWGTIESWEE